MANKFEQILLLYGPIMSLSGSGKVEACMVLYTIHIHACILEHFVGASVCMKAREIIYSEVEYPQRPPSYFGLFFYFVTANKIVPTIAVVKIYTYVYHSVNIATRCSNNILVVNPLQQV